MPGLIDAVLGGDRILHHAPWPRAVVDPSIWSFAAEQLAEGRWTLLGLWAERGAVHMALLDEPAAQIGVLSLDCPGALPFAGLVRRAAPAEAEAARFQEYGVGDEDTADERFAYIKYGA